MNINLEILTLDYALIILTIFFILFSFWKGFINCSLGLLTWVGSILITVYTYEYLSLYLNNLLLSLEFLSGLDQFTYILSMIISIPLIFLITLFILKRLRKFLNSDLEKKLLGIVLDKFFGAFYGLLFAYVVYSSVLYFTMNEDINLLNNINLYLLENSNILKEISLINNNFFSNYL